MTWSTALAASSAGIFKNMHISVPKFCLYYPSSSVCRWWHFTIFMQIFTSCRMGNTSINQFWEGFYQCEWCDFDSTQSYKLKMKIRKSLSAGYHGKSATVYRSVLCCFSSPCSYLRERLKQDCSNSTQSQIVTSAPWLVVFSEAVSWNTDYYQKWTLSPSNPSGGNFSKSL